MTSATAAWAWLVWCFGLALCVACPGCRDSDVLARLDGMGRAPVERDLAAELQRWRPATRGDEFRLGDGIRTGRATFALLALSDGATLRLEAETTIRFSDRKPESNQLAFEIQAGDALLEAGSHDLRLKTSIGEATLTSGARVRLKRTGAGVRYGVEVGLARFEASPGRIVEVAAGRSISIGIGEAVLEPLPDAGAPAARELGPERPTAAETAEPAPLPTGEIAATVTGKGAQLQKPGSNDWSPLPEGSTKLEAGSGLRLDRGTRVAVERDGQRADLDGAGQYTVGGRDAALVRAVRGKVSVPGGAGTELSVPGGTITLSPAGRAEVAVAADRGTSLEVHGGEARIASKAGTETVHAGERARLRQDGRTEVLGRGPGYADFFVAAGASATVHDPSPPTALGFRFGSRCPSGGVIELLRRDGEVLEFSRGDGAADLLLGPGAHRYRLRCLGAGAADEPAASGTITVLRDPGVAQLPRTAPATRVDTDGRRYTVLYQNRLPKLSVRWPKAPPASSYSLAVTTRGGGTRRISSSTPAHAFEEGALGEGTHELTFEAAGVRSPTTSVSVQFDNAAPKASLGSPADRSFGPGAAVTVSGVALEGWEVSVEGKTLALDNQHRFFGEVTAPGGQRGLAVQLAHPRRGVHYYVRHAAGR